jgi:hypothetical protein
MYFLVILQRYYKKAWSNYQDFRGRVFLKFYILGLLLQFFDTFSFFINLTTKTVWSGTVIFIITISALLVVIIKTYCVLCEVRVEDKEHLKALDGTVVGIISRLSPSTV